MLCARQNNGLTLVELLVAIVSAFIVFSGIATLMISSARSFSKTENTIGMNAQANALIDRIGDDLMQAGADLPSNIISITPISTSNIRLVANITGGYQMFASACSTSTTKQIGVDRADAFLASPLPTITIRWADSSISYLVPLALDTAKDSLKLSAKTKFPAGTVLYLDDTVTYSFDAGTKTIHKKLNSTDLIYANNVDAFYVDFRDAANASTTNWAVMQSCSLSVTVIAAIKEKGVPGDGFRRLTSSKKILLRNR